MVKKAACLLASLAYADDEFTMLSMRHAASLSTHSTLDALESVVDSRNVTQMALLVENIAKESLSGDLDESIMKALKGLEVLVTQIKNAMRREHEADQDIMDKLNQCFANAKADLKSEKEDVAELAGQVVRSQSEFKTCRGSVHEAYVKKILDCEDLDDFVASLRWFEGIEQECIWSDSDKVGGHIEAGRIWYESNYKIWQEKHEKCTASLHAYDTADEVCDRIQGHFEIDTCAHRQASYTACNDHFMNSCSACSIEFDEKVNEVECREKDRKVDFSAAEKIKCYVDVLLATPTDEELKENCDANGENCLTNTRIKQYKECENVCHEVDFESGSYQVIDGVNTTHRSETEADEKRCTRELDIHFPAKEGCDPCPPLPPYPCNSEFVTASYGEFQSDSWTEGIPGDTKECPGYVHREWFAFNLGECRPCPALIGHDPTNHDAKCQAFGNEIKIQTSGAPDSWLNLMEVRVNDGRESLTASMSEQYGNYEAKYCVDNDPNTMCHADVGGWLSVKLSAPTCIEHIEVLNRPHVSGYTVDQRLLRGSIEILNQGTKMWQSAFTSVKPKYEFHFEGSTSDAGETDNGFLGCYSSGQSRALGPHWKKRHATSVAECRQLAGSDELMAFGCPMPEGFECWSGNEIQAHEILAAHECAGHLEHHLHGANNVHCVGFNGKYTIEEDGATWFLGGANREPVYRVNWVPTAAAAVASPFASLAGQYTVWYRGGQRSTGAVVGCDGSISQPGIFSDSLHTADVRAKCRQDRDSKATFVVYGTHGAGKYECLWVEGSTIKGHHYTGDQVYWGTIEYRLQSHQSCS
jgi:hypothetical protein